jgi:hypothetical protein
LNEPKKIFLLEKFTLGGKEKHNLALGIYEKAPLKDKTSRSALSRWILRNPIKPLRQVKSDLMIF